VTKIEALVRYAGAAIRLQTGKTVKEWAADEIIDSFVLLEKVPTNSLEQFCQALNITIEASPEEVVAANKAGIEFLKNNGAKVE
jgi:hypothetical protein